MTTALLVVDVQSSLIAEGPWHADRILDRIASLTQAARTAGAPVLFVCDRRVTPDPSLHPRIARLPNEPLIQKDFCDAFFGTDLESRLTATGVRRLVIAGLQTDYCIDTTCRRAISLGFDVLLASDAHTTLDHQDLRADQIIAHHNRILAGLAAGPCTVKVMPSHTIPFT